MANIDLGNLTRYDGKIKEYAEDKYLSKNTANWQMTEKAGAVTCYPVSDTELEPIVDFSFKEVPPISGDKSPSNPSTIEGYTEIQTIRSGRNLLPKVYYSTSGGIFINNNNGSVTINSDGTNSRSWFNIVKSEQPLLLKPGTYIVSGCIGGSSSTYLLYFTYYDSIGNRHSYECTNSPVTFTVTEDVPFDMHYRVEANQTVNITLFPQLELSSSATEYESSARDVFTVQLGNTYYGGSVNLATGEMIVTWGGEYINSFVAMDNNFIQENTVCLSASVSFRHLGNSIPQDRFTTDKFIPQAGNNDVEHMRQSGGALSGASGLNFYINKTRLDLSNAVDPSNPTSEEWLIAGNAWLANNPIFYVGKLFNPYTVQLDPVQIKSLTALDKNTPRLNTLYTNADSIQVGYQKHPARTAYELENAILALGGNE